MNDNKGLERFSMINENEKISLAQCKKGLESDGSKYTDKEVILIRDFLYRMAEWDYQVYLKLKAHEEEFKKEKEKQKQKEQGLDELNEAA